MHEHQKEHLVRSIGSALAATAGAAGRVALACMALVTLIGCGGSPSNRIPFELTEGEWKLSLQEIDDTCDIDLLRDHEFIVFGDDTMVIYGPWQNCQFFSAANVTFEPDGFVASVTRSRRMDPCTVNETVTLTIDYQGFSMNGISHHVFEYRQGDCGGFVSCEWTLAVSGTKEPRNYNCNTAGQNRPFPGTIN